MKPLPLILASTALVVLLVSSRASADIGGKGGGGNTNSAPQIPSGPWCDLPRAEARKLARTFAGTLGKRYGIDGIATYLDAVGYWESRWNPCATGDTGGVSKGFYQLRADSAFRESNGLVYLRPQWPSLYTDGKLSVILAIDYAMRAGVRLLANNAEPYWLAVRRWWKYPSAVHDHGETKYSSSPGVRDRFSQALSAIGVSEDFMYRNFNPAGWPGAKQVMREYGYAYLVK